MRKAEVRFRRGDWSNQELAHFHRLVAVLSNDGISVETDCGYDEGEPWLAFCDADWARCLPICQDQRDICRLGPCLDGCLTGHILRDLIERFVDDRPCRQAGHAPAFVLQQDRIEAAVMTDCVRRPCRRCPSSVQSGRTSAPPQAVQTIR